MWIFVPLRASDVSVDNSSWGRVGRVSTFDKQPRTDPFFNNDDS